jgi:alpha-L-fucosidase
MKKIGLFLFLLPSIFLAQETQQTSEWFADAKLGIFIHWGMYAVDGTSESWAFHNKSVSYPTYMSQMKRFSAENYQPEQWAALIKASGAKYCVITTKHHDGLALYNTNSKLLKPVNSKTGTRSIHSVRASKHRPNKI